MIKPWLLTTCRECGRRIECLSILMRSRPVYDWTHGKPIGPRMITGTPIALCGTCACMLGHIKPEKA